MNKKIKIRYQHELFLFKPILDKMDKRSQKIHKTFLLGSLYFRNNDDKESNKYSLKALGLILQYMRILRSKHQIQDLTAEKNLAISYIQKLVNLNLAYSNFNAVLRFYDILEIIKGNPLQYSYGLLGDKFNQAGEYKQALHYYKILINSQHNDPMVSQYNSKIASIYIRLHNYPLAILYLHNFLYYLLQTSYASHSCGVYNMLGILYYYCGNKKLALWNYRQGLKINPTVPYLRANLINLDYSIILNSVIRDRNYEKSLRYSKLLYKKHLIDKNAYIGCLSLIYSLV